MPFTPSPITIKDASSADQSMIAYSDGTSKAWARPLLDNTGAIISPATAGNQATTNTKLDSVIAELQKIYQPKIQAAAATFTRPANVTAYSFGDLVSNSTTNSSCVAMTIAAARGNDVPGEIVACELEKSGTNIGQAIFWVHLFNVNPFATAPTNGDNGALALALKTGYLGTMEVTCTQSFGDGAAGIGYPLRNNSIPFAPATGTQNVFAVIECRGAWTPISGEVFNLTLMVA